MATRAKFGTKKALKDAKKASRTAIAGGASGAARAGGKIFSKIRTIQRGDQKILNAGKSAKIPTEMQVKKAVLRDLKKYGKVQPETKMMQQAAKTGKEPIEPPGSILSGFNRHQIKEFLKQNPLFP
jgi:hypothetical protein